MILSALPLGMGFLAGLAAVSALFDAIGSELGLPVADPGGAHAVLRPEAIRAGSGGEFSFEATVVQRLLLGSRTQYHLQAGDTALIAEFAAGSDRDALEVGERAQFGFARADIAWVDE